MAPSGESAAAASARHASARASLASDDASRTSPLHSAAKSLVAHLAAPSASNSGPAGGRNNTPRIAPHVALRCGAIARAPNAEPHAAAAAKASSTTCGGLSGWSDSNTCGAAQGAYAADAHIAPRSVAASRSRVMDPGGALGGGRKETGKYAATTS